MRTTVRLDDRLLERAKREALRRSLTLTALIEEGLRLVMCRPATRRSAQTVVLPICRQGGGALPGVDLNNSADLVDQMERRR